MNRLPSVMERRLFVMKRLHSVTERRLFATKRLPSVTERRLSVTKKLKSVTERRLFVTERLHSVTERRLSVTKRRLSVMERLPSCIKSDSWGRKQSEMDRKRQKTGFFEIQSWPRTSVRPECRSRGDETQIKLEDSSRRHLLNKRGRGRRHPCADFTTSSNFSSAVFGALSLASTSGADSRKLKSRLLLTA